jgi:beta-glucosidase
MVLGFRQSVRNGPELPVGLVLNPMSVITRERQRIATSAAERANDFTMVRSLARCSKRHIRQPFLKCPDLARNIKDGDLEVINQPLDFWGLNYYTPMRVKDDPGSAFPACPALCACRSSLDKTDIGWEIEPAGLSHVVEVSL